MAGFGIDELQAEYVADIKLRALNNEYIANRIEEIQSLDEQARELTDRLNDEGKIKELIIQQLKEIKKKYGKPRRTEILMQYEIPEVDTTPQVETYRSKIYFTEKGYFKKVKLTSLRMNDEHTLRDGDEIIYEQESDNTERLMFFTDAGQVYKSNVADFEPCKASNVGAFVSTELEFDENEKVVGGICVGKDDDSGNVVFIFKNGKGVKIPLESYKTKANRKKLTGALSTDSPCVYVGYEKEAYDIVLLSDNGRGLVVSTDNIPLKSTRTSSGVTLMTLKAKNYVSKAEIATEEKYPLLKKMKKSIPSSGVILEKK